MKKILYVEDEPSLAHIVKETLVSKNFDVIANRISELTQISDKLQLGGKRYIGLKVATGVAEMSGSTAGSLMSGAAAPTGRIAAAGAVVGGIMTFGQLGKLSLSPKTARLTLAMLRGGPLGMSSKAAARLIAQTSIGYPMVFRFADGTIETLMYNQNLELVPAEEGNQAPPFPVEGVNPEQQELIQ